MAIDDILSRIEDDAKAEAAAMIDTAEAEALAIIEGAKEDAKAERVRSVASAEREAAQEGDTLVANARLAVRDRLLAEKRARTERVLAEARTTLEKLPDEEYLGFIAEQVAAMAAGGETLAIAAADAKRLARLPEVLAERGVHVTIAPEPAPIASGVLLTGDRVSAEVSPASLIADRRDELLLIAARELFGGLE